MVLFGAFIGLWRENFNPEKIKGGGSWTGGGEELAEVGQPAGVVVDRPQIGPAGQEHRGQELQPLEWLIGQSRIYF